MCLFFIRIDIASNCSDQIAGCETIQVINWNDFFAIQDEEIRRDYLTGIYNTVLLKDVAAKRRINDIPLLESVIRFLFDNVGNIVSPKKIADSLTSYGRKTTSVTVENYIEALTDAYVLYKAGRYDVKGNQHLKSLEKYYLVDVSLRHLLLELPMGENGIRQVNIVNFLLES